MVLSSDSMQCNLMETCWKMSWWFSEMTGRPIWILSNRSTCGVWTISCLPCSDCLIGSSDTTIVADAMSSDHSQQLFAIVSNVIFYFENKNYETECHRITRNNCSVTKSLVFIRTYSYKRVFEEKYSYFTCIFVIYSYFLWFRAHSTRYELFEPVKSYLIYALLS